MSESPATTASRRGLLWGLLVVIVAGILFAGLNTSGTGSRNEVEWLAEGPGLDFGTRGIAFTEPMVSEASFSPEFGLSIEMILKPRRQEAAGFRFIAVLHNGSDRGQLLVGQYLDSIVVMNGDDYRHLRKTPRIWSEITGLGEDEPFYLTVTSGPDGTALYLNGKRRSKKTFALTVPAGEPSRLVLGNSVYGDDPWSGEVRGLALHARALEPEEVVARVEAWNLGGVFGDFPGEEPHLDFPLKNREGRSARDRSADQVELSFPVGKTFVSRKSFSPGLDERPLRSSVVQDVVLNLLAFVPLGVVLVFLLRPPLGGRRAVILAILGGALLSFGIELAQSWMPTRSSSLLDLALNAGGTALGAFLGLFIASRASPASPADEGGTEEGEEPAA